VLACFLLMDVDPALLSIDQFPVTKPESESMSMEVSLLMI